MNRDFLYKLNGNTKGWFSVYLDSLAKEPRIAWYPSANDDMRPMMFFSERFMDLVGLEMPQEELPDLYIYTDYYPKGVCKGIMDKLFKDRSYWGSSGENSTCIKVIHHEKLMGRLDDGMDKAKGCVRHTAHLPHHGEIHFIEIELTSTVFGLIRARMLYLFVTNESFCARQLLPNKVEISHLVYQKYNRKEYYFFLSKENTKKEIERRKKCSNGIWLMAVARQLAVRWVYIDNSLEEFKFSWQPIETLAPFPELCPEYPHPLEAEEILRIRGSLWWSRGGDITLLQMATDREPNFHLPAKMQVLATTPQEEKLQRAVTMLI